MAIGNHNFFRDQLITDFLIASTNQILENCPLGNLPKRELKNERRKKLEYKIQGFEKCRKN